MNFEDRLRSWFEAQPLQDRRDNYIVVRSLLKGRYEPGVEIRGPQPRLQIFDMEKEFKKMEGMYDSEDHIEKVFDQLYAPNYKVSICIDVDVSGGRVAVGRGRLCEVGRVRAVW
jgi:hypothetical protein